MASLQAVLAAYALLLAAGCPLSAAAGPERAVDVALVVAGDVSLSMTKEELHTQRDGLIAAFRSPEILAAIRSGALGRIAVTYLEWADPDTQRVIVPWTIVTDGQTTEAFADHVAAAPMVSGYRTSISCGLLFAETQIETGGIETKRAVIDVSGDGSNNEGPAVNVVRDLIVNKGVTINGLPFADEEAQHPPFGPTPIDLRRYFENNVIGGPGAFAMPVTDVAGFTAAIRQKLVLEIAGLPAPDVVRLGSLTAPAQNSGATAASTGESVAFLH